MVKKYLAWLCVALAALACTDTTVAPDAGITPSFEKGGVGRPVVLVNPNVHGNGTATTIQEGIDMVAEGGRVMVKPGTYDESIVINKGLTLEAIDEESGPVVIEQVLTAPPNPPGRSAVIKVATTEPVVIRGISVHHVGLRGLNNFTETSTPFPVDLTIDHASFAGEYPFATVGAAYGVSVVNNAGLSGARAHLEVRNSSIHVNGQSISLGGDVDALIDHNSLSATSACVRVSPVGQTVTVLAGAAISANILNNELTDCGGANPGTRAINVQDVTLASMVVPPVTTVGTVNIVGNTFRTTPTAATACTEAAIAYEFASGVIEHNSFIAAVPPCGTVGQSRGGPGAIRVGSSVTGTRTANVSVRFNDIAGNAFAGLWVGRNQTTSLDARCNWWGAASGPSGVGTGTGDAVVVEAGAARPVLSPFAAEPIANGGACQLEFSLWSAPVNLGVPINTTANEFDPALSPDGLSLYFNSNEAGGLGLGDLWVSHRACTDCPWGALTNLGSPINSSSAEGGPALSSDGLLLFFDSDRPGGLGGRDIYVSHRTDPASDLGWGPPVNLGPDVNTPMADQNAAYLRLPDGAVTLYFHRATPDIHIFAVPLAQDGTPLEPAVFVSELSDPPPGDARAPTIRADGKEIVFGSTRAGGSGLQDLWVSTRSSLGDPWSKPENLGMPINSSSAELNPELSHDGRTLFFSSTRPGGVGGNDLWMATRTPIP